MRIVSIHSALTKAGKKPLTMRGERNKIYKLEADL